ncbi:elongation factor Ts, mitochondrial-like [Raphanus sativus]|uniref:Elongation factor Ts, mitochondrial-like n=1 Tax=Raphanus sativus TaxID=3726 RepID=A0A9W3DEN1_RAPSA|nr:elongation factor Ts, mitochondrial-like [Raphanus sativus]
MLAVAQSEGKVAVIELNCETYFVARNDIFKYLALAMAKRALLVGDSSQQVSGVFPFGTELFEELKLNLDHPKVNGETTVSNAVTEVAAIMCENVRFRRGFYHPTSIWHRLSQETSKLVWLNKNLCLIPTGCKESLSKLVSLSRWVHFFKVVLPSNKSKLDSSLSRKTFLSCETFLKRESFFALAMVVFISYLC